MNNNDIDSFNNLFLQIQNTNKTQGLITETQNGGLLIENSEYVDTNEFANVNVNANANANTNEFVDGNDFINANANTNEFVDTNESDKMSGGAKINSLVDILKRIDSLTTFNLIKSIDAVLNGNVLEIKSINLGEDNVSNSNFYNMNVTVGSKTYYLNHARLNNTIADKNISFFYERNGENTKAFKPLDLIMVRLSSTKINDKPIDSNNCSEELIHYVIAKIVSHQLATSALATYAADKVKVVSTTHEQTLKSGFDDNKYHLMQFDHQKDFKGDATFDVFGQTYLVREQIIHVISIISPSDSSISMKYCKPDTLSGLKNLVKALAISRPDRQYNDDAQLLYLSLVNDNTVYNNCLASSQKQIDDLDKIESFELKTSISNALTDNCKTTTTIGTYIIDKNDNIYTYFGNDNRPKQLFKKKNSSGTNYVSVIDVDNIHVKLKFSNSDNRNYILTNANEKNTSFPIYYDEQSLGITNSAKPLQKLHLYICTHDLNPLQSNIKLIDLFCKLI